MKRKLNIFVDVVDIQKYYNLDFPFTLREKKHKRIALKIINSLPRDKNGTIPLENLYTWISTVGGILFNITTNHYFHQYAKKTWDL